MSIAGFVDIILPRFFRNAMVSLTHSILLSASRDRMVVAAFVRHHPARAAGLAADDAAALLLIFAPPSARENSLKNPDIECVMPQPVSATDLFDCKITIVIGHR